MWCTWWGSMWQIGEGEDHMFPGWQGNSCTSVVFIYTCCPVGTEHHAWIIKLQSHGQKFLVAPAKWFWKLCFFIYVNHTWRVYTQNGVKWKVQYLNYNRKHSDRNKTSLRAPLSLSPSSLCLSVTLMSSTSFSSFQHLLPVPQSWMSVETLKKSPVTERVTWPGCTTSGFFKT